MTGVKAKVLSIGVNCPNCDFHQDVDAAEYGESKLAAMTEYKTTCDRCDHEYTFELDVFV